MAVDAPVGYARAFTYGIPARFTVLPGQLVWVPFGSRTIQGIVTELSVARPDFAIRDILQPVEPAPLLGPEQLRLGLWLSRYYRSPLFAALSVMLPPGFESHVRSRIMPVAGFAADGDELREGNGGGTGSIVGQGADEPGRFRQAAGTPQSGKAE